MFPKAKLPSAPVVTERLSSATVTVAASSGLPALSRTIPERESAGAADAEATIAARRRAAIELARKITETARKFFILVWI